MNKSLHIVKDIVPDSIAEEMNIEKGDSILKINETVIEDIFDYQFLCEDCELNVLVKKKNGEEWLLEIEKEEDEDLGIIFDNGLMDEYRSCSNKCIFCFIDQMPKGMRETLYFKDDDARLSFLQGNYITLTNMSEHDINRIIRYRLSPINISFQTTNPELRCKMLNNRFAGEALKKVDLLYQAEIEMNGQIVLCKGVNDREELERTISDLYQYIPYLKSVSIVPVGLSKYREGLYPLEPFEKKDAVLLLETVTKWQKKAYAEYGLHFIHASDEWYILAEKNMPEEETYDGYLQLENGVGMIRLMENEFEEELAFQNQEWKNRKNELLEETVTLITGQLVYPYIQKFANRFMDSFPMKHVNVIPIVNYFFGEMITVTGLLTGQDIINQCKGKELGDRAVLPENVLRSGEDVLLDDTTLSDLKKALQVPVDIVKSSGCDFVGILLERVRE